MKRLNYLKKLVDFIYFISIFTILKMAVDLSKILLDNKEMLPLKLTGIEFTSIDITVKIVLIFVTISALLFIYSIYLLRKVISFFIKKEIFNDEVILLLNKIGKCLLASFLIKAIPLILYIYAFNHKFESPHFEYHFSLICLGLFFMVLSEVFKIAKDMKEENELTV
jgi:hypothetical protein